VRLSDLADEQVAEEDVETALVSKVWTDQQIRRHLPLAAEERQLLACRVEWDVSYEDAGAALGWDAKRTARVKRALNRHLLRVRRKCDA
jgi:hypothetical protein